MKKWKRSDLKLTDIALLPKDEYNDDNESSESQVELPGHLVVPQKGFLLP